MTARESETTPRKNHESLRKELEREVITSFVDLDLYKLTMGQFAWRHFPDIPVKYGFINRSKSVRLADFIPEDILQMHLQKLQNLKITDEEIEYLRSVEIRGGKLFKEDYLNSLRNLKLPPVNLTKKDGQYEITVAGSWSEAIYMETYILSTVNELYYRTVSHQSGLTEDQVLAEGRERLDKKINRLKNLIASEKVAGREGPFFMDFGTRRRYSGPWQEEVVATLTREFPYNFTGTSNVLLGMKLGLPVKGTFAHEMDMVFTGIYHQEDDQAGYFVSHDKLLDMWYQEYGAPLSVALTDTYGDDYFFRHFTREQAEKWIGLRQDSGDPITFGEKAIAFYENLGIDPKEKTIVFSDGLDIDSIIEIYNHFKGQVRMIFGWGTTLTNDMGFDTLSLVVKVLEANGWPTGKLSNNLAKATGDPEAIARNIRLSIYQNSYRQEVRV